MGVGPLREEFDFIDRDDGWGPLPILGMSADWECWSINVDPETRRFIHDAPIGGL